MNNGERGMWIDNDEFLYSLWRMSGQSKAKFIQENRSTLDSYINKQLNREPAR